MLKPVLVRKVWFDDTYMWLNLNDGRILEIPKNWFPKLEHASSQDLNQYQFIGNGVGIYWDALDEDIDVGNLLLGYGDYKAQKH